MRRSRGLRCGLGIAAIVGALSSSISRTDQIQDSVSSSLEEKAAVDVPLKERSVIEYIPEVYTDFFSSLSTMKENWPAIVVEELPGGKIGCFVGYSELDRNFEHFMRFFDAPRPRSVHIQTLYVDTTTVPINVNVLLEYTSLPQESRETIADHLVKKFGRSLYTPQLSEGSGMLWRARDYNVILSIYRRNEHSDAVALSFIRTSQTLK